MDKQIFDRNVEYQLGKNYTVSVLLLLYDYKLYNDEVDEEDKKGVTTSTFTKISTRYGGPARRARELADMNLIEIEEEPNPRIKEAFKLTEEGVEVAKGLKNLEDILKNMDEKIQQRSEKSVWI